MSPPRLTLATSLSLALVGITLAFALLQGLLLRRWGDSLLSAAADQREHASRAAESMVLRTLGGAEATVVGLAAQSASGILDVAQPLAVEKALLAQLLANSDLAEATFTRAPGDDGGRGAGPWQVSVDREGPESALVTLFTHREGHDFVVERRARPPGEWTLEGAAFVREPDPGPDPTAHLTFVSTLRHHRFSSAPLWTDLHYAERDSVRPESERRVVVTVMQAVEDGRGRIVGVARAGLVATRLDEVTRIPVDPADPADPHRVFLTDDRGRLLTRLRPDQRFVDLDGDLRLDTEGLPTEVRAALGQPALRDAEPGHPTMSRFDVEGRTFVLSGFDLPEAQDWRVGVLVPEDHALAGLRQARRTLLAASVVALLLLVAAVAAGLRSVRESLEGIVGTSEAMTRFDFGPSAVRSPFRDVAGVLAGLEQAKTALRAMGRYVPVELVRQLYRDRREPELGGEPRDVTLLFTDIEGFTTLSERVAPDALARRLGQYFEALTDAIHGSGGTVDKYIGDAVMALWNAPQWVPDHATRACTAALACLEASRRLEGQRLAEGWPPFRTRLGLHRAEVLVGHFGAPDRMAYTALGDGVNVASRLEGLNKLYGTSLLVSETVRAAAGDGFLFRLVDQVAVKGRSGGVRVYELLGEAVSVPPERRRVAAAYEQAFAAYRRRGFADALALLTLQPDDPPSQVLAERCQRFLASPPPDDWDGTHAATEK